MSMAEANIESLDANLNLHFLKVLIEASKMQLVRNDETMIAFAKEFNIPIVDIWDIWNKKSQSFNKTLLDSVGITEEVWKEL